MLHLSSPKRRNDLGTVSVDSSSRPVFWLYAYYLHLILSKEQATVDPWHQEKLPLPNYFGHRAAHTGLTPAISISGESSLPGTARSARCCRPGGSVSIMFPQNHAVSSIAWAAGQTFSPFPALSGSLCPFWLDSTSFVCQLVGQKSSSRTCHARPPRSGQLRGRPLKVRLAASANAESQSGKRHFLNMFPFVLFLHWSSKHRLRSIAAPPLPAMPCQAGRLLTFILDNLTRRGIAIGRIN